MSKNKLRFYIVAAAVFVAFTVISFAVPFAKNGAFWVAYIFAVLAIAAQVYVYPKAFDGASAKSKFYGFPIARISTIYLAVQLVLSLVVMATTKWVPAWIPACVFVVALCAAVAGFVSVDTMREEIERQDVKLKKDVTLMRSLQSKINVLPAQCSGETAKALEKLAEDIRFSDPVSGEATADVETELSALIDELQQAVIDADEAAVLTLCRKAAVTLNERNRICKLNK